jgi:hypothetical protein
MLIDSRAINTVREESVLVPFWFIAYLFDFIGLFRNKQYYVFLKLRYKGRFSFVVVFRILYYIIKVILLL